MNKLHISIEFLDTILDASMKTTFSYRGKDNEMYVLGCLESTANMIYIMLIQSGGDSCALAKKAQHYAGLAIERMSELHYETLEGKDADSVNTEFSKKIEQIRSRS